MIIRVFKIMGGRFVEIYHSHSSQFPEVDERVK